MAKLPDETIARIFNLQQQLLERIDEATTTESRLLAQGFAGAPSGEPLSKLNMAKQRQLSPSLSSFKMLGKD